jgi:hypothetical protein
MGGGEIHIEIVLRAKYEYMKTDVTLFYQEKRNSYVRACEESMHTILNTRMT